MLTFSPAIIAGGITAWLCFLLALIRPIFHDEASTFYFAGSTLPYLFKMLLQDVHPPLYFLLAWGWFNVAGDSLYGLRILSSCLMGASVFVFLCALKTWLQAYPSRLTALAIASSPFLVFCGYFGRYYALVTFLWACCFWALGAATRKPCPRNCAVVGLLGATLFLTNYAAALVAVAGLIPFTLTLISRRQWKNLAALALPGLLFLVLWLPILLSQLTTDLPSRWDGAAIVTPMRLIKNAGFLAWTLAVSDGLPPWSVAGLIMAPMLLVLAASAALAGLFSRKSATEPSREVYLHLTMLSILMLLAGVMVGVLFLPGPMYSFLPPRVALCGFAWLTLLVVIPASKFRYRRSILIAVITAHVAGLLSMLAFRETTNWAYEVPADEIAAASMNVADKNIGADAVYLPFKSMAMIRYDLEQRIATRGTNDILLQPKQPAAMTSVNQLIIIRHSRAPEWPPSAAVNDPAATDPPGSWTRTGSIPYLKEDPAAQKLKAQFSGEKILPDKIRLETWTRN